MRLLAMLFLLIFFAVPLQAGTDWNGVGQGSDKCKGRGCDDPGDDPGDDPVVEPVVVAVDGVNGADGADGKDGEDGKDGAPGDNGTDGKSGLKGYDGSNGLPGQDGESYPGGVAGALAAASIEHPNPGGIMFGLGAGTFEGGSAVAFGAGKNFDLEKKYLDQISFDVNAFITNEGETGAAASVNFHW